MEKGWQYYYDLGKKAYEDKKTDSALVYLENVIKEKQTFADVYNMLGLLYYSKSRFEDAITAFKQALRLNPNYTEAGLNLTIVYNELGRYGESAGVYEKAQEGKKDTEYYLDPYIRGKLANMHAELGKIYKDLSHYNDAAEEYIKALKLRPEFVDVRVNLGIVYRDNKELDASKREFEEALKINPTFPDAIIQLGLTYYMMEQFDNAKREWLKVLNLRPGDKMAKMYMNLLMGVAKRQ